MVARYCFRGLRLLRPDHQRPHRRRQSCQNPLQLIPVSISVNQHQSNISKKITYPAQTALDHASCIVMHLCCLQGFSRTCSSTCDTFPDPETNCMNLGALSALQAGPYVDFVDYLRSSHRQALLVSIASPFYVPEAVQSHVHLHPGDE
jgi:hypothetical protein